MTTVIQNLPTPPTPGNPYTEFNSKAFALLGALPQFVDEANQLGSELTQAAEGAESDAEAARLSKEAAAGSAQAAGTHAGNASTDAGRAAGSAGSANSAKEAAELARNAARDYAESIDPANLLNRANHTGTQAIETVKGLEEALAKRIAKSSDTGVMYVPEGTDTQRPAPADIPAGVAAVRGNSTSLTDYFLELWNRKTGVWDALASRSWVTAAINALNKITGAGAAPYYGARAWVNFNGTGTVAIRASGNVSSITDHGTGDYTVNFTIPMQDANFAAVGTISHSTFTASAVQGYGADNTDKTVSSWRFRTGYANPPGSNWLATDYSAVHVAIFR